MAGSPPAGGTPRAARAHPLLRRSGRGDAAFGLAAQAVSGLVLALAAAMLAYLVREALPAFTHAGWGLLGKRGWLAPLGSRVDLASLAWGTLATTVLAVVFATPVALGAALLVAEAAPGPMRRAVAWLLELLSVVPSVVIGLWALVVLAPHLAGFERWIARHTGAAQLLTPPSGRTVFTVSVVLGIMVVPVIAQAARGALDSVPRPAREAAMALGASRWQALRTAALPHARRRVVSAVLVGTASALGEAVAVAVVLGASLAVGLNVFRTGGSTVAANIATGFGAGGERSALIASGSLLLAVSVLVVAAAKVLAAKHATRPSPPAGAVLPAEPDAGQEPLQQPPRERAALRRRRVTLSSLARPALVGAGVLAVAPVVAIIVYTVADGYHELAAHGPAGGAFQPVVATLEQVGIGGLVAVLAGLPLAVALAEYGGGRLTEACRHVIGVLRQVPPVVAGLLVASFWVIGLGFGYSGLAGGLALGLVMLPMVVGASEELIGALPRGLREASLALGVTRWRTSVSVVLPAAAAGIASRSLVALARVTGATAPLLVTALGTSATRLNPLSGPQSSLTLFAFSKATSGATAEAWAAGLVLVAAALVLSGAAQLLGRRSGATAGAA